MKKYLTLLGIACVFLGCQTPDRLLLTETYEATGFNMFASVTLNADGTFVQEATVSSCVGGKHVDRVMGEYELVGDYLVLEPKTLVQLYFELDNEIAEEHSVVYSDTVDFKVRRRYQILEYDSLKLLLSEEYYSHWGFKTDENDYDQLANAYNSGSIHGDFFLRSGPGQISGSQLDVSALPVHYQKRFLKEPVMTPVQKITEDRQQGEFGYAETHYRFQLGAGTRDGVFKGMNFYGGRDHEQIKIVEVTDSVCYGMASHYGENETSIQVGQMVSTRVSQ